MLVRILSFFSLGVLLLCPLDAPPAGRTTQGHRFFDVAKMRSCSREVKVEEAKVAPPVLKPSVPSAGFHPFVLKPNAPSGGIPPLVLKPSEGSEGFSHASGRRPRARKASAARRGAKRDRLLNIFILTSANLHCNRHAFNMKIE